MNIGNDWLKSCGLLWCVALLAGGCTTTSEEQKEKEKAAVISTLRIHQEAPAAQMDFTVRVPVNREPPVMLTVDKEPFLTEADVVEARLVEVMGGFDLQIQFDHHGSLLLEQYTTSHPGGRLAVFSQFGDQRADSRWLGAPATARRNTTGILTLTPDASREEAERVVLGLNNVAKKTKDRNKW